MKKRTPHLLAALLFGTALLTGCVAVPPAAPPQPEAWPAQRYYDEARQAQASGNYSAALEQLAELKSRYPDSPYAALVPLEIAYARYKTGDHNLAIEAADQFIAQQPNAASLDYAWYLKGLAHLKLAAQGDENSSGFDSGNSRAAYQNFAQLVKGFPESQYQPEARQQLEQLRNQLAEHELDIARTLLQQGNQQAALERANYLASNYPGTAAASAALAMLQGAPAADNIASTISNSERRHEEWLLQRPPEHFTIQIAGTSRRAWLDEFVARHQLQGQIVWFRRQDQGREWYTILYGDYDNQAKAEAEIPELKSRLAIDDAWVRQFEPIQNTLRNAAASH